MAENQDTIKEKQDSGPVDGGPQLDLTKSSKQIYFELLRTWVYHAEMQNHLHAHFPYYLMNNYPQLFQLNNGQAAGPGMMGQFMSGAGTAAANGGGTSAPGSGTGQGTNGAGNRGRTETTDPTRPDDAINRHGGYEYVIAPLWKRFAAEAIDIAIIFLLKIMTTLAFIDAFEIDLLYMDLDAIRNSFEEDYTELLSFTSELIFLEIGIKIAVCIYEAVWTAHVQVIPGSATPGKMLMGLRIVYAESVAVLEPQPQPGLLSNQVPLRALLYPGTTPSFGRAFARAVVKNVVIAFFFPMCLLLLCFRQNRSIYDVMTKTVVVEDNPNPVLRRR
ncbi:protein FAM8A1 [Anopheles arabiensis]|uniref:RDD domain-containing protein n=4 Tax=gambiae species complex TaxID=44542 RepID=A0A1S4H7C4_ANOGA|nr:protein FAM8A1 [Anopheles arabiensis]XP_040236763.1 protein FAM8A1 [Anopheles coluzzii]XP_317955.5 protein FAM8A1 [Anopheles gambiae]